MLDSRLFSSFVILFTVSLAWAKPMPEFTAQDATGQKITYAPQKIKKQTLIVFWASWCKSCRREITAINKFYESPQRSVDILAINLDSNPQKAQKALQDAHVGYPNLFDPKGQAADLFNIESTPSLFLVDTGGEILKSGNQLSQVLPYLKAQVTRDTVLMGTNISFVVLGDDVTQTNQAIDTSLTEIKRIEDLMTDWRESPLMQLNHQAGIKPVTLPAEIISLLAKAKELSKLSEGTFDITCSPLGKLWDYSKPNVTPPTDTQIKQALQLVGSEKLQIDLNKNTAYLPLKNMRVDLGGIAKGYAVMKAAEKLKSSGYSNFAVKAGGDIFVHGHNQNHQLWNVTLPNKAVLPVSNGAVSTSANTERFFIYKNKRYGHLIDPRTGYPSEASQSVTILAPDSILAEGLSKAVFILGPQKGLELLAKLGPVQAVIVDQNGKLWATPGLQSPKTVALSGPTAQ